MDVRILEARELLLAVVVGRATQRELSKRIRELFREFYKNLASFDVGKHGLNVELYRGEPGVDLLAANEIGVQVPARQLSSLQQTR